MQNNHKPVTSRRIAASFGRKAARYKDNAHFQLELVQRLAIMLGGRDLSGQLWADLGCATAPLVAALRAQGGELPSLVGVDIARDSLRVAAAAGVMPVLSDLNYPCFRPVSLDGAVISSVIQWLQTPLHSLAQVVNMIKPGGVLLLAAFTEGAYGEITRVRELCALPPIGWFPTHNELLEACAQAGVQITASSEISRASHYPDARSALRALSQIGATPVSGSQLTRARLEEFCRIYDDLFGSPRGVSLTERATILCGVRQ